MNRVKSALPKADLTASPVAGFAVDSEWDADLATLAEEKSKSIADFDFNQLWWTVLNESSKC